MLLLLAFGLRRSVADDGFRLILGLVSFFVCLIAWIAQTLKGRITGNMSRDDEYREILGLSNASYGRDKATGKLAEEMPDPDFEAGMKAIIPEERTDKRFYSKIAGASHKNADGTYRRPAIAKCKPLDKLELKHEPDNPFDSNAIAVISPSGKQMGYLDSRLASEVTSQRRRWKAHWEAYFRRATRHPETGKVVGCVLFLVRMAPEETPAK